MKKTFPINHVFNVTILREEDTWIATSEELAFVTEGESYEDAVKHAWEIAPEMAVLKGFRNSESDVKLSFQQYYNEKAPLFAVA